jgi:hypothetical protein
MLAAAAPRPHAVATDIPIDIVGGRCFVRVRLDNRPATLLLDTGAETTLLCEAAANRLLLRPDAPRPYAHSGTVRGGVKAPSPPRRPIRRRWILQGKPGVRPIATPPPANA